MRIFKFIAAFVFLMLAAGCSRKETVNEKFLQPAHWRDLALNNILPAWAKHIKDSTNLSFYCNLDENWTPTNDTIRYPSMIARNLFGFSAGYLMSGDESHLSMARELKEYLFKYAWDRTYGGWYDALTPDGKPLKTSKSTFVQVYVITGLTMYYFTTHDSQVLDFINRSNNLLEANAWDEVYGGYYDNVRQDWTKENQLKSISSQLAPVSGYLLYLYMATRNPDYLKQSEKIMDAVIAHARDSTSGWVLESFDRKWNYLPPNNEHEVNIGHNIEVAWVLLRLHRLNKRREYLDLGKILTDKLHRYGVDRSSGFWYADVSNKDPLQHTDYTHWWIQAYGNMFDLLVSDHLEDDEARDLFVAGAKYWETHFLDQTRGDTHMSVKPDGTVLAGAKANQYKASYHNMEYAMLNQLYAALWSASKPIDLHFNITTSRNHEMLYPLPIEVTDVLIASCLINDQTVTVKMSDGGLEMPRLEEARVVVTVE